MTRQRSRNDAPTVRVTVPTSVKVRSALLLVLTAVAIAAFVGVVFSVVVVGLGLLVT